MANKASVLHIIINLGYDNVCRPETVLYTTIDGVFMIMLSLVCCYL